MSLFTVMVVLGMLASGMCVALIGSVKMSLAEKLKIDESRVGGLVSTFGLAMIPVMVLAGELIDRFGRGSVLIGGSVLIACALIVLAQSKAYWQSVLGVVLLSAGWAAAINTLNVLVIDAFPGRGEVYASNLGNTFFGLGAFFTPLVVAFLVRRLGLPSALFALAVFSLIFGVLTLGLPMPAAQADAHKEVTVAASLWGNPFVWICAVGLFFYFPLESTMAAWFSTYLRDSGMKESKAAVLLSVFWLTYLVARLSVAFSEKYLPSGPVIILALSLAGTAVLLMVVFSRGALMAGIAVALAGFIFGPIFPTLIAVLKDHCPPSVFGRAVGVFFALGGIGGATVPMLIGICARKSGVQKAFGIAAGAAAGLSVIALILVQYAR